jgi:hypothetical protein
LPDDFWRLIRHRQCFDRLSPTADSVGDDKEITAKVERLPGTVKRIEEGGLREVGSRSHGAVQQ